MFRERIREAGGSDVLFEAVRHQLQSQGHLARGVQIIDATLVDAPKQHISRQDKALLEADATPADWAPAQRRQKDRDASWTKKHGKSHHGYKLSINADKKYKLIRRKQVSTAKIHDTNHFDSLLDPLNTRREVWADKGYQDNERERRLTKAGWRLNI